MAKIISLVGPTASGKTAVGVSLAEQISGEVVSADSMQIYRGLDIGTAKPTVEEIRDVPHHMLDVVDPEESFSVAAYVAMADAVICDILARGKVPILVGGTGQYHEAVVRGLQFAPTPEDKALRQALEEEITRVGGEVLLQRLEAVDPETASRLFPNDHKRIVRALEIYELTGKTQSYHDAETQKIPPRYEALYLGLACEDRAVQRQRIADRVDVMMTQGFLEEVERYLSLPSDCTAMQAIGYRELRGYLQGTCSLEEAVSLLKIRSQQYGKRQLTWFRNRMTVDFVFGTGESAVDFPQYLEYFLASCRKFL